jgi:dolichyl-diphosphooligosaccharide--protein glycosyltransferase
MNKSMYLGILAGIIIVGGIGWYFASSRSSTPSQSTDAYNSDQSGQTNGQTSTSSADQNQTANASSSANTTSMNPVVTLTTTKGDIVIALDPTHAPIAVANFLKLAESGFYDGVKFHRVIAGFMIQAGDPLTKDDSKKSAWGTGGPGYTIQDEFNNGLTNDRGTIAMANTGAPNSSGSQFFINQVDNSFLNGKYTVFGKVTSGMDVVDAIDATPTAAGDVPINAITITKVTVQK